MQQLTLRSSHLQLLCIQRGAYVDVSLGQPPDFTVSTVAGPPGLSSSQLLQLSHTQRLTERLLDPPVLPAAGLDLLAPPVSGSVKENNEEKKKNDVHLLVRQNRHVEAESTRWQQCSTRLI